MYLPQTTININNTTINSINNLNTTTDSNPQQVQNYITWINGHLKKRPGVRLVDNLQVDLSDGVLLIHLIEVISGDIFPDANLNPNNVQEYKENVEKVLKFMQNKSIKMHQTSAKEIVEGNLKSIMKLILAIAAHFKPSNIKQNINNQLIIRNNNNSTDTTNQNLNKNSSTKFTTTTNNMPTTNNNNNNANTSKQIRNDSMTHLVQAACVNLADVRRFQAKNEAFNSTYIKRENNNTFNNTQSTTINDSSFNLNETQKESTKQFQNKNETYNIDDFDGLNQILDFNNELSKDVEEAKLILLNLQNLLLTGTDNDDTSSGGFHDDIIYEGTTAEEQVIVLKSKIQQLEILCNDLKQELSYAKNESVHFNGLQSGLQIRLNEQDNTILQMKSEILQLNLTNEQLNKEKNDLILKLEERTRLINEIKSELNNRNLTIDRLKADFTNADKEREQNKFLKQQVKNFSDTLQMVKEKESTLANLIACTDRKLGIIDTKMSHQNMKKKLITSEEINVLKDSILKLRSSFKPNHPLQYIVNTLEQGFFTIIDRVNTPINLPQSTTTTTTTQINQPLLPTGLLQTIITSPPGAASSTNFQQQQQQSNKLNENTNAVINPSSASSASSTSSTSSTSSSSTASVKTDRNDNMIPLPSNNIHYSSTSAISNKNILNPLRTQSSQPLLNTNYPQFSEIKRQQQQHHHQQQQQQSNNYLEHTGQGSQTKVLYYTDKSVTPFMTTIYKSIGKVTLCDFKDVLKLKPNNYRFHFKTQDPEFGIVKEEITNDNTFIPSYEGRIVAWIQELE